MNFRQMPFAVADGPRNMAADETLLCAAGAGQASLRFYGWTEATLSLGYFQLSSIRRADPRWLSLPWVRRPTGGAMLVHHHELTYALALPLTPEKKPRLWMSDMHRIIARALENLGLRGDFRAADQSQNPAETSTLCFEQPMADDLLHGSHKFLGSSQRKHRHALLQHGALLLAQSPFTPTLPGVKELTGKDLTAAALAGAIVQAFQEMTGFSVAQAAWSSAEERMIERLVAEKYSRSAWNEKR